MPERHARTPVPVAVPPRAPYGERLARHFRVDTAPTLTTTTRHSEVAATRLRHPAPGHGMTLPLPPEPAFDVAVVLSAYEFHEVWHHGRRLTANAYGRGSVQVVDHMSGHAFNMLTPFDSVRFHLPRAALDELADQNGEPRVAGLACAAETRDPVLAALAEALLPALCRPQEADSLFVDHVTMAVQTHVAHAYGTGQPAGGKQPGRLARWREVRAKDFLAARLDTDVSLAEVAECCGLSPAHFARAFKCTTGETPHAWLRRLRIDKAQKLLVASDMSIAQIAISCGFADQSHLTRVFAAGVGRPPAQWRRDARDDPRGAGAPHGSRQAQGACALG